MNKIKLVFKVEGGRWKMRKMPKAFCASARSASLIPKPYGLVPNRGLVQSLQLRTALCAYFQQFQNVRLSRNRSNEKYFSYTARSSSAGFTVLISIVIASIVIAIALSIMGITLKQLALAGIARESEVAFQAANAGVECIRFYDISDSEGNTLDVPGNGSAQGSAATITCLSGSPVSNSNGPAASGDEQLFTWTWDSNSICTDVSVYKFYSASGDEDMDPLITDRNCPEGVECTIIKARGYNAPCSDISSGRVVERELTVIY